MVQIERKGFPLSVGEVEFFVPLTSETLSDMLKLNDDIDKITEEFRLKYTNKLDELNLSEGVDADKLNKINAAKKEYLAEAYDLILGPGAFDRLFEYHPYVDDLELTFPAVITEFVTQIERFQKKQKKREDKILADFKKKKKRK